MRLNAHHTLVVLSIAFATAAISAPGALGSVRPDDRAGTHGIGSAAATAAASPDWIERAAIRHNATRKSPAVRPDDRGDIRGIEPTPAPQQSPQSTAVGGIRMDGAAWAGVSLLLLLLLAGAAQVARQRRQLNVTY